jgi:hypothetical protein
MRKRPAVPMYLSNALNAMSLGRARAQASQAMVRKRGTIRRARASRTKAVPAETFSKAAIAE